MSKDVHQIPPEVKVHRLRPSTLERILSKEASRFVRRLCEEYKITDIPVVFRNYYVWQRAQMDHISFLGGLLENILLLSDNQDDVLRLVKDAKKQVDCLKLPTPFGIIAYAREMVKLARRRREVIALFSGFQDAGYDDTERIGVAESVLLAGDGILSLVPITDSLKTALIKVNRKIGKRLPLYATFKESGDHEDGLLFHPNEARAIARNPDAFIVGIRYLRSYHAADTREMITSCRTLIKLGREQSVVKYVQLAYGREGDIYTENADVVIALSKDKPVIRLFERLQPYASRYDPSKYTYSPGIWLAIDDSNNCQDRIRVPTSNLSDLARDTEFCDKLEHFAMVCQSVGVAFGLVSFAAYPSEARQLLDKADDLQAVISSLTQQVLVINYGHDFSHPIHHGIPSPAAYALLIDQARQDMDGFKRKIESQKATIERPVAYTVLDLLKSELGWDKRR